MLLMKQMSFKIRSHEQYEQAYISKGLFLLDFRKSLPRKQDLLVEMPLSPSLDWELQPTPQCNQILIDSRVAWGKY